MAVTNVGSGGTPFHQWLGLRWESVDDPSGAVAVDLDMRPDICGPAGILEGGVTATLVDVAAGSAAAAETGRLVFTEHIAISYLAPGRTGPIRATGVVIRAGKSDVVIEVRVVDRGQDDRLMAVALVTMRLARNEMTIEVAPDA
jgi:uncharacterized protein (TIGR00369 family)